MWIEQTEGAKVLAARSERTKGPRRRRCRSSEILIAVVDRPERLSEAINSVLPGAPTVIQTCIVSL